MSETNRKLASIREITEIRPIPDADAIECAIVGGGWPVVVKKGDFSVGDLAIYFEIDSWIPHELAPFLSKGREPREYNGVVGERLKTIKLRGQVSQGLLLPLSSIPMHVYCVVNDLTGEPYRVDEIVWELGEDLTLELNVQKWEAPIPACLSGQVRGNFPSFIPKTDQERCQNLTYEIFEKYNGESYEVTVKLDGSSCTIYVKDGEIGVCSRNWDLDETKGNSFWMAARTQGIIDSLTQFHTETGSNVALQMELIGEGIQKNQEGIQGQRLYLFDAYDIDAKSYLSPMGRFSLMAKLNEYGSSLEHTPILETGLVVTDRFSNVEEILAFAEGPSMNPKVNREGIVFKGNTTGFSFKAISNKWLLKNE